MPAKHSVHSAELPKLVALECVPSGHGSGALAPSAQYEPWSHGRQKVAFCAGCRVPAAQGSHASRPIDAAKVLQQLANALQVPVILHTDAHKHQRMLKSVSLFSSMPPVELKPIIESIEVLNFYAGQEVISEDARDQDMYVVMEGTAECTKLGVNDGGPIAQYAKGDFFGERAR